MDAINADFAKMSRRKLKVDNGIGKERAASKPEKVGHGTRQRD